MRRVEDTEDMKDAEDIKDEEDTEDEDVDVANRIWEGGIITTCMATARIWEAPVGTRDQLINTKQLLRI